MCVHEKWEDPNKSPHTKILASFEFCSIDSVNIGADFIGGQLIAILVVNSSCPDGYHHRDYYDNFYGHYLTSSYDNGGILSTTITNILIVLKIIAAYAVPFVMFIIFIIIMTYFIYRNDYSITYQKNIWWRVIESCVIWSLYCFTYTYYL